MSKQSVARIKTVTAFGLAFCCAAMNWRGAGVNAVSQTSGSQSSAAQQEKPFDQKQKIAELMKKIAGQEDQPAEQVFRNVQVLKGMPAARLLRIMEMGFGRSLGVDCTHCHVVDQWDKEDKPTKQIARDMFNMMLAINNKYLKNIANLKSANPVVNCTTCHRGQTKPETNLPETAPRQ